MNNRNSVNYLKLSVTNTEEADKYLVFIYSDNFQLCGGYSLLSDWPASVGKSLLIVPLLSYTTQVSEYLGHISLNPDQIISAGLGSGLTPAFSS